MTHRQEAGKQRWNVTLPALLLVLLTKVPPGSNTQSCAMMLCAALQAEVKRRSEADRQIQSHFDSEVKALQVEVAWQQAYASVVMLFNLNSVESMHVSKVNTAGPRSALHLLNLWHALLRT